MGSVKYLMSKGSLSRKDNSLCFRVGDKNKYIPIEGIKEIYCLNEISFNTKLIDILASNGIILHMFNHYEGYSGTFYPRKQLKSGKMMIKQLKKFDENRLYIAKTIVEGIAENIYQVLYHYKKHGKDVNDTLDWIKVEFRSKIKSIDTINRLMQLEGELWQRFYSEFKKILLEEFVFNKRVKRPPDNPINALISFGNTMLYTKTVSILYQTHLDQRISFLHEPNEGRFSLSLDMCEVFKPIIVFKTIFELINNKRLKVEKHFDKQVNYCLLNEEGKKIFIEAFDKRISGTFEHAKLKKQRSFKNAIKLDCYKLQKYIVEDKEFKCFSIKECM